MYPRTNYEMSEEDLKSILDACQATTCIMIGGYMSPSPQENANRAWQELGEKMGFDYMTVRPIEGKGQRFFTAIPSETEDQKQERLKRQKKEERQIEIKKLENEITERQERLNFLKNIVE